MYNKYIRLNKQKIQKKQFQKNRFDWLIICSVSPAYPHIFLFFPAKIHVINVDWASLKREILNLKKIWFEFFMTILNRERNAYNLNFITDNPINFFRTMKNCLKKLASFFVYLFTHQVLGLFLSDSRS